MFNLLQLGFSRIDKRGLVVDDIFQLVDEFLYLLGGDPTSTLLGYIALIISSSLSCDLRWDIGHPQLEILDREISLLGVCGRGLGRPCRWVRHRSGVRSRSVHKPQFYIAIVSTTTTDSQYLVRAPLSTVLEIGLTSHSYSVQSIIYSRSRNRLDHSTLNHYLLALPSRPQRE